MADLKLMEPQINFKRCLTCHSEFYSFKSTKKASYCSMRCLSYHTHNKVTHDFKMLTCVKCSQEKPSSEFFQRAGKHEPSCKVCYSKHNQLFFESRLEQVEFKELKELHALLKKVKSQGWNVTPSDENMMLRIAWDWLPRHRMSLFPTEHHAKTLWYELVFIYKAQREKIIYNYG